MNADPDLSTESPVLSGVAEPTQPDIRVGTIASAIEEGEKTLLWIDFGAHLGVRRAIMTLAKRYRAPQLVGRQVCAVVNPQLNNTTVNQVLALGMPDRSGDMVLICPDHRVPDGGKLF
ncbi:tRNA-binding protein [Asaia krungthepensis]|uniref:Chaperone n=1 Tax=Asaia krungthepensis NRIC 0535 TaxID=1307925 RepID=A0ABQ0Q1X3_9PROT|nr:tRNA-binding protein [Asaia krungthepensis]GBQ87472.1 chaperone [Asaia krungthepensis NRIC 0535]